MGRGGHLLTFATLAGIVVALGTAGNMVATTPLVSNPPLARALFRIEEDSAKVLEIHPAAEQLPESIPDSPRTSEL